MPGKFEVYQEKAQEYRFRLKTATGEVVAVSEAHDSMEACRRAIEAVRKHAPYAKLEDSAVAAAPAS
ncbi:YegP family protein [Streptacidiphilus monticola]|uniref:YegP family protein n=1 Tax=Streptacidiphilus monticola TaxID=2161674 RepID=A0ABW1G0B4_9ACTN